MSSPARPPSVVQRHQLATYFGLTFAISWAIWLGLILGSLHIQTPVGAALNVVAIAGPSIAALVLATVLGRGELRRLLAGFSLSRPSVRWMVVALVLPLAMMVAAIAVSVAAFGAPRPARDIRPGRRGDGRVRPGAVPGWASGGGTRLARLRPAPAAAAPKRVGREHPPRTGLGVLASPPVFRPGDRPIRDAQCRHQSGLCDRRISSAGRSVSRCCSPGCSTKPGAASSS